MTGPELLAIVQDHVTQNLKIYVGAFVVLLPFLVIFRRWSIPLVLYAVEWAIYAVIMHVVLHGFLGAASWFKEQSTMANALDLQKRNPNWTTPLFDVWNREIYNPPWVIYLEIGFVVAILLLMYRIRPFRPQKLKKQKKKMEETKARMGDSAIRKYKPGGE
jgi:hypothetical protein